MGNLNLILDVLSLRQRLITPKENAQYVVGLQRTEAWNVEVEMGEAPAGRSSVQICDVRANLWHQPLAQRVSFTEAKHCILSMVPSALGNSQMNIKTRRSIKLAPGGTVNTTGNLGLPSRERGKLVTGGVRQWAEWEGSGSFLGPPLSPPPYTCHLVYIVTLLGGVFCLISQPRKLRPRDGKWFFSQSVLQVNIYLY